MVFSSHRVCGVAHFTSRFIEIGVVKLILQWDFPWQVPTSFVPDSFSIEKAAKFVKRLQFCLPQTMHPSE